MRWPSDRGTHIADPEEPRLLMRRAARWASKSLGWKAKSNRELIMNIKQRMRNRGNIRLHWVAGHAGISQNERADELAVLAIEAS